MEFSIMEWRKNYNKVQHLGDKLKEYDLKQDVRERLEDEIASITKRSNVYLDQCGMRASKPLWKYNNEDPRTWRSHESFKYEHLLVL